MEDGLSFKAPSRRVEHCDLTCVLLHFFSFTIVLAWLHHSKTPPQAAKNSYRYVANRWITPPLHCLDKNMRLLQRQRVLPQAW